MRIEFQTKTKVMLIPENEADAFDLGVTLGKLAPKTGLLVYPDDDGIPRLIMLTETLLQHCDIHGGDESTNDAEDDDQAAKDN